MTTVNVSTIGSSGDYANIAAWEAATDNDLVAADVIEVGLVYESETVNSGSLIVEGATTDEGRFRVLRAAPGLEYDPVSDTGIKLTSTAASGFPILDIREDFFVVQGLGCEMKQSNGAAATITSPNTAEGVMCVRCFVLVDGSGTAANQSAWVAYANDAICRECVASGKGSLMNYGFIFQGALVGRDGKAFNCAVYNAQAVTGYGIWAEAGGAIANCVSMGCKLDFNDGLADFADYNIASDTSADGSNSQNSQVVADTWRDAANDDFRVKDENSPQVNAGVWIPPVKPLHPEVALTTPGSMPSLRTGLTRCWPLSEGHGATAEDIAGGATFNLDLTGGTTHKWFRNLALIGLGSEQTGQRAESSVSNYKSFYKQKGAWTIECVVRPQIGDYYYFFKEFDSSTPNCRYMIGSNPSNDLVIYIMDNTSSLVKSAGMGNIRGDIPQHILLTDDEGDIEVWLNGDILYTTSYTRPSESLMTMDSVSIAENGQCDFLSLMMWDRRLTPDEIRHRTQHPWSLIGGEEPSDLLGGYRPQPTQRTDYDVGPYEFVPPVRTALQPKPELPVLNRAHPLAQGLTLAVPFMERAGGSIRDLTHNAVGAGNNLAPGQIGPTFASGGNVEVESSEVLSGDRISISMWLRPDTYPARDIYLLRGLLTGAETNSSYTLWITSGQLRLTYWGVAHYDMKDTSWMVAGETVHIGVVDDGGYINFYVNGEYVERVYNGAPVMAATVPGRLRIGSSTTPGTNFWDGDIGDVKTWQRTLTAREIADLYADELRGSWSLYNPDGSIFSKATMLAGR